MFSSFLKVLESGKNGPILVRPGLVAEAGKKKVFRCLLERAPLKYVGLFDAMHESRTARIPSGERIQS